MATWPCCWIATDYTGADFKTGRRLRRVGASTMRGFDAFHQSERTVGWREVKAVLVAGAATELHVEPPPCLARGW
jgi:hypothetical protein